jgi:beta-galactosidase
MAKGISGGIMRCLGLCAAAVAISPLAALAAPPKKPVPPPPPARFVLPLSGLWQTAVETGSPADSWLRAPVPEAKQVMQPAPTDCKAAGAVWLWKQFSIPDAWQGKTRILRLLFDSIADNSEVWLNGTLLGSHKGGSPFDLVATKAAKIGGENLLAIRASVSSAGRIGLLQSVQLVAHDEAYLKAVIPVMDAYGHVNLEIHLLNTSNISGSATIDVTIAPADMPTRLVQKSNQEVLLTPGENISNFITSVRGKDLKPWLLNSPNTYQLKVTFHQGKDLLDEIELPIGFRTIALKEGALVLNNLSISAVPPPVNYRLASANLGADDEQKAREQLLSLKGSGASVVTLFNPSPELLRLTDMAGMAVVEGCRPGLSPEEERLEAAALMERDRHHPSVVAWRFDHSLTNDQLAAFRKLDSSRIIAAGKGSNAQVAAPGKGAFEGATPAWLLSDR